MPCAVGGLAAQACLRLRRINPSAVVNPARRRRSARLWVKMGESYGPVRNFMPETLEPRPDGCVLRGTAQGSCYQPLREAPQTSDWWQMDHASRDRLVTSALTITLTVRELPDGLALYLKTEGQDRLPLHLRAQGLFGGLCFGHGLIHTGTSGGTGKSGIPSCRSRNAQAGEN